MYTEFTFWIIFSIIAAIIIIIDLYATEHTSGKLGLKRSIIWSGVWIFTALLFCTCIYFFLEKGHQRGLEFLTGYLIEYSLSVDNLFVFLMIFKVMGISRSEPAAYLKMGNIKRCCF